MTELRQGGVVRERYTYDPIGNISRLERDGSAIDYTVGPYSQVTPAAGMTGFGSVPGAYTWDPSGRMASSFRSDSKTSYTTAYTYDGAARLVGVDETIASGEVLRTSYAYDVDDQLVLERHGPGDEVFRFQGWRVDTRADRTIEKLLPMVSLDDGVLRWTFVEPDGHALETYASDGRLETVSLLGAYGGHLPAISGGRGRPWPIDGFHGSDGDERNDVIAMGARHLRSDGEGLWMQPEPLLYLGPTNGDLGRPLAYTGVYASGNPVGAQDRNGRFTLTLLISGYLNGYFHDQNDVSQAMADPKVWATSGGIAAGGTVLWAGGVAVAPAVAAFGARNAPGLNTAGLLVAEVVEPTGAGLGGPVVGAAGKVVVDVASDTLSTASRGLSGKGGVFTTSTNAAGGRVVTSVGDISQSDVATHVNSALFAGGDVRVF